MGVTSQSIQTILTAVQFAEVKTVCDLGAQNDYRDEVIRTNPSKYPYISEWWKARGVEYTAIDLSGENGSLKYDLSKVIKGLGQFDLVCDFGTSEHVKNFYTCYKNIHNLTKVGGLMIHENPLIENWPEHGLHYIDTEFFRLLAERNEYQVLSLGTQAAMGNTKDGWNVVCIMRKLKDVPFCKRADFPIFVSYTDKEYERSQEWIYNPKNKL